MSAMVQSDLVDRALALFDALHADLDPDNESTDRALITERFAISRELAEQLGQGVLQLEITEELQHEDYANAG